MRSLVQEAIFSIYHVNKQSREAQGLSLTDDGQKLTIRPQYLHNLLCEIRVVVQAHCSEEFVTISLSVHTNGAYVDAYIDAFTMHGSNGQIRKPDVANGVNNEPNLIYTTRPQLQPFFQNVIE